METPKEAGSEKSHSQTVFVLALLCAFGAIITIMLFFSLSHKPIPQLSGATQRLTTDALMCDDTHLGQKLASTVLASTYWNDESQTNATLIECENGKKLTLEYEDGTSTTYKVELEKQKNYTISEPPDYGQQHTSYHIFTIYGEANDIWIVQNTKLWPDGPNPEPNTVDQVFIIHPPRNPGGEVSYEHFTMHFSDSYEKKQTIEHDNMVYVFHCDKMSSQSLYFSELMLNNCSSVEYGPSTEQLQPITFVLGAYGVGGKTYLDLSKEAVPYANSENFDLLLNPSNPSSMAIEENNNVYVPSNWITLRELDGFPF